MNKTAKLIQKDLFDYLEANGKKDKVDEMAINQLCDYLHVYYENRELVMEPGGSVQVFQSGATNVSGVFVAMNKAMDYIISMSYKMGIYEIMKAKLMAYGKMTVEANERIK